MQNKSFSVLALRTILYSVGDKKAWRICSHVWRHFLRGWTDESDLEYMSNRRYK